ncbi:MAG: hypothetical protein LBQ50_08980 [Planctomycetaceae bacterium]|jgi:hypothetical protein|nr:hypothetical protein [Planctomycetaceae bacterium]
MTTLHFQTTILEDGKIPLVLPESLRGFDVEINIRKKESVSKKKYTMQEYLDSITGLLEGYTLEDVDELRFQSMIEKHCHAYTAN